MEMSHAVRKVAAVVRVKVGQLVGFSVGGRLLAAEVIEDRGDLGASGQQVVRLAVQDPMMKGEHFEVEVPVEWLADPPAQARQPAAPQRPSRSTARPSAASLSSTARPLRSATGRTTGGTSG